jgi:hypothetical protein
MQRLKRKEINMSVHGMKPQFKDYAGYTEWRSDWRELYAHASADIRNSKYQIKMMQQNGDSDSAVLAKLQREHRFKRVTARKLMTVLEEAKIHWGNIKNMRKGIKAQMAEFPINIENARNIDFHFNKKSVEFDFVPMWVLKVKGKTFYVNHMDCQVPWTTRETPDHPSTKGSLRIKRGNILIDEEGTATIS